MKTKLHGNEPRVTMRKLTTWLSFMGLLICLNCNSQPKMSDDEITALNTVKEMAGAFGRNDIETFASYWTYPGTYLFDKSGVVVFSNKVIWKAFIQNFRDSLPNDYNESRATQVSVKTVGNGIIMASVIWGRYNEKSEQIGTFGDVYTLVKPEGSNRWLVTMAIGNDSDKFVSLGSGK